MRRTFGYVCTIGLTLLLSVVPYTTVNAAPGDTLFSDDFERSGLGSDWSTTNSGNSGIGTHTANSGTRSLYTRWDTVNVTSRAIDLSSAPGAEVSMWIRIGDDIYNYFSEWPDSSGEDLAIQYLNSSSSWVTLETFIGGDHTAGQIYNRTYTLPASALHSNFQLRFYLNGGSGYDYDYYHIDDVTITETAALPSLGYPFCDDFEGGFSNWEVTSLGGDAGIGSHTYSSASNSLYLRWDEVYVSTLAIDTSAATSPMLEFWLRRGHDVFSEDPDNNEDLLVEYLDDTGSWNTLDTFNGGGTDGEMMNLSYALPADARHADFKVRFYMERGSGSDFDYWHIDDFCVSAPASPVAEYHLDEASWGTVTDSSGNGNDGGTSGTVTPSLTSPVVSGSPGTCGYADIPDNSTTNARDAIDSGIDVDSDVGNQGTISFWYKSNVRWGGNNGNRQLFDASSSTTGKYFHLTLISQPSQNGVLQFGLEDSSDDDFRIETGNNNIAANTWKHIAVTWDLAANEVNIYIDGSLERSSNIASNGTLGDMDTLYFGDNRSSYLPNDSTNNSANGSIDEIRIYDYVQGSSEIQADMNATHACNTSSIDHIRIIHDGSALTCEPESITIQACQTADCSTLYTSDVTVTLSPSGWIPADTVTFSGGETTLELRHTTAEAVTLGVSSTTPTPTGSNDCYVSGAAGSCLMTFHDTGFLFDVPTLTSCATSAAITISAVRKDDTTEACVPSFSNRTETINFWSTYSNPNSGTNSVSINGTDVATSSPGTGIPLTFDAAGQSSFTVNYPDAGLMELDASFTGTGSEAGLTMTGTDSFVSVPAKFYVYSGDAGATCASGDANCSVFKKAGENFNLSVRAACADDSVTPNFIHSGLTIGHNLIAPAAGSAGAINIGTVDILDADNGEASISNQNVSEVGVFTFDVSAATTYFGETLPGGTSTNIGRFIPDRFTVADNTPQFTDSCTGFTYQDQPFYYAAGNSPVLTVTALNTAGNTVNNYGDTFWKLTSDLSNRNYIDQSGAAAAFVDNLDADHATLADAADFDGTGTLTLDDGITGDDFTYQRQILEAPFNANVDLTFSIADLTDDDNVCYDSNNDGTCEDYVIAGITGTSLRLGRMQLFDAFGPQTSDLDMPVVAEYYDGADFTENSDDSCTILPVPASIGLLNWTDNLQNGETNVNAVSAALATGLGQVTLLAPGLGADGNDGSVTASMDLNAISWLRFDWDNTDGDGNPLTGVDDPSGIATFGMYRGDDRFLLWREAQ